MTSTYNFKVSFTVLLLSLFLRALLRDEIFDSDKVRNEIDHDHAVSPMYISDMNPKQFAAIVQVFPLLTSYFKTKFPLMSNQDTADSIYIVRFTSYHHASVHEASIASKLRQKNWQWVHRNNPAAALPTDFALIKAPKATLTDVQNHFHRSPGIKDVHPERTLPLSLKTIDTSSTRSAASSLSMHDAPFIEKPCQDDPHKLCIQRIYGGRLQTRHTFHLQVNNTDQDHSNLHHHHHRTLQQDRNLALILRADQLWQLGYRGTGIKMGVFDTGIINDHPDVDNIVERTNWTHEPTLDDGLGHGSFVAGVIAGHNEACPGLAPNVSLHTFRVFTNDQVSFTSWFLDAFNYAMATEMDIVNLSIGGPDYLDRPFVEKVWEVTASGIIMVSAIGNDGPLFGTLNNPADQNDVIGVGGIGYDDRIAAFSSRGMSTWELPLGYGRAKPDVIAYGMSVQGARIQGGCRGLSGTSVAAPVVAGAVCLLASTLPEEKRSMLNPASMKQALVEGARRLPNLSMFEQGQGALDVIASYEVLKTYVPRASIVPSVLNMTECPFAWPFCTQPLYAHAMPVMFNATILNGMGVVGRVEGPPKWTPLDEGGRLLDVRFDVSDTLWPWSGNLAMYFRVAPEGEEFEGNASGEVTITVVSPPGVGEEQPRMSTVTLPVQTRIIPTPPRHKRILWDQFHSLRYPPAYFPRDNLENRHDILDWHGDHPHTNYHDMYDFLRKKGYFLEILGSPLTCFNASQYGVLMIVDSEEEFYPEEIDKIEVDVREKGLGLVVFADWYTIDNVERMRFYDDNTRSWWDAATGGANIPALNDLLAPFGAAFLGGAHNAEVNIPGVPAFKMFSGSSIGIFPRGSYMYNATSNGGEDDEDTGGNRRPIHVLGMTRVDNGRLVLYGDSNCLDSSDNGSPCYEMLVKVLRFAGDGSDELLTEKAKLFKRIATKKLLPKRRSDMNLTQTSFVLQHGLKYGIFIYYFGCLCY